jgi:hypothetical protein
LSIVLEFLRDELDPFINADGIATWTFSERDPDTGEVAVGHDIERFECERLRQRLAISTVNINERDIDLAVRGEVFKVDVLIARKEPTAVATDVVPVKDGATGGSSSIDLSKVLGGPFDRRILIAVGGRGGDGSDALRFETRGGKGGQGGSAFIGGGPVITSSLFIALGGMGGNGGFCNEEEGADGGKGGQAKISIPYERTVRNTAFACGGGGGNGNAAVKVFLEKSGKEGGDGGNGNDAEVRALAPSIARAASGDGGRGCTGSTGLEKGGQGGGGGDAGTICFVKVDGRVAANNSISIAKASGGDGGHGGVGGSTYLDGKVGGNGGNGGKGGNTHIETGAGYVGLNNTSFGGDGGHGGIGGAGDLGDGPPGKGGPPGQGTAASLGALALPGEPGKDGQQPVLGCP